MINFLKIILTHTIVPVAGIEYKCTSSETARPATQRALSLAAIGSTGTGFLGGGVGATGGWGACPLPLKLSMQAPAALRKAPARCTASGQKWASTTSMRVRTQNPPTTTSPNCQPTRPSLSVSLLSKLPPLQANGASQGVVKYEGHPS